MSTAVGGRQIAILAAGIAVILGGLLGPAGGL
jgi:hypothetical protein